MKESMGVMEARVSEMNYKYLAFAWHLLGYSSHNELSPCTCHLQVAKLATALPGHH